MRIALGADHAGFPLKDTILMDLRDSGYEVLDFGTCDSEPVDYPDFAEAVGTAVARGEAERGIVLCGSGVGACIAANKIVGVRACQCHDTYSAHQGVEHDDMNILCLGARIVGAELAREIVVSFVNARFSGAERHQRRLDKVKEIERKYAHSVAP